MYPAYVPAMERYLSGTCQFFGNIFIMSRNIFFEYCDWLFPILFEFDRRSPDISTRSAQGLRAPGFLAERLLGIYYTYHKADYKILELPRVHFVSGRQYTFQQTANFLFPPGSQIRSVVKKIIK